jgi:hypothetical protein
MPMPYAGAISSTHDGVNIEMGRQGLAQPRLGVGELP